MNQSGSIALCLLATHEGGGGAPHTRPGYNVLPRSSKRETTTFSDTLQES